MTIGVALEEDMKCLYFMGEAPGTTTDKQVFLVTSADSGISSKKHPKVSESGIKINHVENPEMKFSGDSTKIPSLNYYNVTMSVTNHLPASSLVVFCAAPSVQKPSGPPPQCPLLALWGLAPGGRAAPPLENPHTAGSRSSVGSTWIFPRESSTMERSPLCSATPTSVSKSNLQTVEIEHPRWLWSTNQQSNKIQLNFKGCPCNKCTLRLIICQSNII